MARDAEVVTIRWEELPASRGSTALGEELRTSLVVDVQKDHEHAHHRIVLTLSPGEYLRLPDNLDEFLTNPPIAANAGEVRVAKKKPKKKGGPFDDGTENATMMDSSAADAKGTAEVDTETTTEPPDPTPQAESQPATTKTAAAEELDTTAVLPDYLNKVFSKLRRRHDLVLDSRGDVGLPGAELDERYHDVRKTAEKLRYDTEAAQSTDLLAGKLYVACRNLQSVLDDLQDTCTACDFVLTRAKRAPRASRNTFGYGVLYQMGYYDDPKALDEYDDAAAKIFKVSRRMEKRIKRSKKA